MEILRQHQGPIDAVFVAIGGGGLISGVGAYIKAEHARWGPIIRKDHRGREIVQRWVAHDPAILASDITRPERVHSTSRRRGLSPHTRGATSR